MLCFPTALAVGNLPTGITDGHRPSVITDGIEKPSVRFCDEHITDGPVAVGNPSVTLYYRRLFSVTDDFWPSVTPCFLVVIGYPLSYFINIIRSPLSLTRITSS